MPAEMNSYNKMGVVPQQDYMLDVDLLSDQNFSTLLKRHAYARLEEFNPARSNPNFFYGSSGRLHSSVSGIHPATDPRISRGYIRRSVVDNADPTSPYRLYFMYNPAAIQRTYVSYLDQQALDPFNTIFQAGNLVAPPGILDFSFDLFFDRQTENANGSMPRGVLEDFDYFDLVVRGVVPDNQSPDLPDNGVLMVNPRNLTVVFSPQLSVQGRPYAATVRYEKFDHRMRPIRMTISLSMKVLYIGPVRPDFTFAASNEERRFAATVPYDDTVKFEVTPESYDALEIIAAARRAAAKKAEFDSPYTANPVSGDMGRFGVERGFGPGHIGIDYKTPMGTAVFAPENGAVYDVAYEATNSGLFAGFGRCVCLQIDEYFCFYAHLENVRVSKGEGVLKNATVGFTGNTGNSSGPHLHFEVRTPSVANGNAIDPAPLIAQRGWVLF